MTTHGPNSAGSVSVTTRGIHDRIPSPLQVLTAVERGHPDVSVVFHDTRDGRGDGVAMLALGSALEDPSDTALDETLNSLRDRLARYSDAPCEIPLFFHLGFEPDVEQESWAGFGQRSVRCPWVVFTWKPGADDLSVTRLTGLDASSAPAPFDRAWVEAIVERSRDCDSNPRRVGGSIEVTWPGVAPYRNAVAAAIEASDGNDGLEKVVLARTGEVTDQRGFSPTSVLAALDRQYGTARTFALAPSGLSNATFLGASPERLIRSDGNEVCTMALAGTREHEAGQDAEQAAQALLKSSKDRAEHGYVTRMIRDTLEELGADVDVAQTPKPMILANVIHLETPIRARFSQTNPPNFGRLVEALHPTPAVCGTPTDEARAFIRAHEDLERGLYTGAVGWQTADGGGDTTVALRCGLIEGKMARIFAGGGITADSDVEAELKETSAKFEPMLQALRRGGARQ